MSTLKLLSKIFNSSEEIIFDDTSRIVLMSDCHRGDGSWADEFSRNQNIYFVALNHYYKNNYTYIELGDGDELWGNKSYSDIIHMHSDIFWLLSQFHEQKRLYLIYGNHDMVKKNNGFVENNLYYFFDQRNRAQIPLFENIKVHEGIVLKHSTNYNKILLIHGHQVDFINNQMWRVSRFLVRYLWRAVASFGITDPTRAAKNYKKKELVEKRLTEWVIREGHILIAGHTHRPMCPEVSQPPYFNTGSSVHPRCITSIEIESGNITLVKWSIKTKQDGTLFIGRDIISQVPVTGHINSGHIEV